MRYPNFLEKNGSIGLLATSCGSNVNPYRIRTQLGIKYFESLNYKIKKGHRIFRNVNACSAPGVLRAKDFMSMYKNKNVDFIWSTGGGEIMMNMLPYVDFEKIKKLPPKFFMGFSDNTNLTFTLTTICDVATIYASSIGNFAYENLKEDVKDMFKLMHKEKLSFTSYPFYCGINSYIANKTALTNTVYKDENKWKSTTHEQISFNGRIIGGCIDILVCLCGTKYDNVKNFIEKYKDDGIIWYFDPCDLNSTGLFRAFFQLKEAGWFKYAKGFLIGRPYCNVTPLNYSFFQAIIEGLNDLNVPVLYDVDISHVSPSIPIINGSLAQIEYKNNQGSITFTLK